MDESYDKSQKEDNFDDFEKELSQEDDEDSKDNRVEFKNSYEYKEYYNKEKKDKKKQKRNPLNQLSNRKNISNLNKIQNPNKVISNSFNNNYHNIIQNQYKEYGINFPNPLLNLNNQNDIIRNNIYYQNYLNTNYPFSHQYSHGLFNNQNHFFDYNNISLNTNYSLLNQYRHPIPLINPSRILPNLPNLNMLINSNDISNYNTIQNPFKDYNINIPNGLLNQIPNQNYFYYQNQLLNQNYNIPLFYHPYNIYNINASQNLPYNYQPQFVNDINTYIQNKALYENLSNNNFNLHSEISKYKNNKIKISPNFNNINNNSNTSQKNKNKISKKNKKEKNKSINKEIKNNSGDNNIIICIDDNNKDFEYKRGLNEIKVIKFKDLKFPKDINEQIINKAKENNYIITEEENKMLSYNYNNKDKIIFNNYMFYSLDAISLYPAHIIKSKNNIISIFFTEEQKKLNIKDFPYYDSHNHKSINNDIFLNLLKKRINEYNNYKKEKEKIIDENFNEKKCGFNINSTNNNYYLYTNMDIDIIKAKLKEDEIEKLKKNLNTNICHLSDTTTNKNNKPYEIFNKSRDFIKDLNDEELILYTILERLEKKYEIFPRIIFYEYYLTIKGEKVIISNEIKKGYSELDYVFYSKCNYQYYNEKPKIVRKEYSYGEKYISEENFEIKENILYFFDLKSSIYNELNNQNLEELFNKCKEFTYLYESRGWIDKKTKKEIVLIYDSADINEIEKEYKNKINEFVENNNEFSFSFVYFNKPIFFTHSLAINLYHEAKSQLEKIFKQEEDIRKKIEDYEKKVELQEKNKRKNNNKKL